MSTRHLGRNLFREPRTDDAARETDAAPVPRRVYIKKFDLELPGYTTGCQNCDSLARDQTSCKNHSDRCRTRPMEEIAKTDEGKERIAEVGLRQDPYAAKEVDKSDPGIRTPRVQGEQRVREPLDMKPAPPLLFPFQRKVTSSRPSNNDAPKTTTNDYQTNHAATTNGDDKSTTVDSDSDQPKTT